MPKLTNPEAISAASAVARGELLQMNILVRDIYDRLEELEKKASDQEQQPQPAPTPAQEPKQLQSPKIRKENSNG